MCLFLRGSEEIETLPMPTTSNRQSASNYRKCSHGPVEIYRSSRSWTVRLRLCAVDFRQ
jgi:hypothetical protein